MRLRRFLNLLIALYFAFTGALCLLVLGYSVATRVVWRRQVANDLFDVLPERIPLLLISLVAVFAVMRIFWGHCAHDKDRKRGRWIYGVLACAFLFSLFCVLSVRGIAVNDGGFLDTCINEFMEGNYDSLYSGYLATYPFQIGYVMFGQLLYLAFGPSNYLIYQMINIGSILLTVWFLHRITYELFEREDLADFTAVLSLGAVVLYAYATLVYNDIWSLAPQMAAVYLTMRYIRTGSRRAMAGGVAAIAIACVLKTNCYIALIAMVLSLLFAGLRELPSWRALSGKALWAAIAVLVTLGAIRAVNAGYAAAAGLPAMPDGVPSSAYFAMGMHQVEDDGCVKYGWYDGSNVSFLSAGGNDAEAASALARADMRESIEAFCETPKYFVKFYLNKFLQQWGDGTCSSMRQMEMSGRNVTPRSQMAEALMYGALGDVLLEIMNVFHTVVYLGAVCYFGSLFHRGWKRQREGSGSHGDAAPLITTNEAFLVMFILGGMLFHEIWEASSRYVIRYYLSLLPLAACGYGRLLDSISPIAGRTTGKNQ